MDVGISSAALKELIVCSMLQCVAVCCRVLQCDV